jgi:hypothetical protein
MMSSTGTWPTRMTHQRCRERVSAPWQCLTGPRTTGRRVVGTTALRQAALAHPSLSRILAEQGLTVGPVRPAGGRPCHPAGGGLRSRSSQVLHTVHSCVRVRHLGAAARTSSHLPPTPPDECSTDSTPRPTHAARPTAHLITAARLSSSITARRAVDSPSRPRRSGGRPPLEQEVVQPPKRPAVRALQQEQDTSRRASQKRMRAW